MSDAPAPPHVVVLGGGSAGWMTACLLHHEWSARGGRVTVVESPQIGIIGVGEGSTPQLKAFFEHLGIAEDEWMGPCEATYKLGIRFLGWSEREGFEGYFHPFPGPTDLHSEPGFVANCALARQKVDCPVHPDDWFLATFLAEQRRDPREPDNFPFPPSYGYHFNSHRLGEFLRDWGVAKGIEHRPLTVDEIELGPDGDVAALLCEGGERIAGDFFVDCSGFRSIIAQGKLGVRFRSFGENLFNDSAVVMPTQHAALFVPQTEAIAMKAGWRWSIPLTSRVGNGYVYSSRFVDRDGAEAELRAALGEAADGVEARHLSMKVGRVEETWSRNCLAVGLSQGFLEPLEATALHIVIVTALEFVRAFEDGGFAAKNRAAYNASIGARYDGIRDYIVAHYRLNQRTDTDYWRENAVNDALSDGLKAMMTAWFRNGDMLAANDRAYGGRRYYSNASWHCLFAGYGTFPPADKLGPAPEGIRVADPAIARRMLESCATNFAPLADPTA